MIPRIYLTGAYLLLEVWETFDCIKGKLSCLICNWFGEKYQPRVLYSTAQYSISIEAFWLYFNLLHKQSSVLFDSKRCAFTINYLLGST